MLDGLLFFPVTPFTAADEVNLPVLAEHVARGVAAGAGAVFAGCGTGELHALDLAELGEVVGTAVSAAAGSVPVYGGAGGPISTVRRQLRELERRGAQGVLLAPPYLVAGPQQGYLDYYRTLAEGTSLAVIIYQRGTVTLSPETVVELSKIENITGFKDGLGDLDRVQRIVSAVRSYRGRDSFQFFNGMPTAELTQRAYQAIGVELYSSAVFAFAPQIALEFLAALRGNDGVTMDILLRDFYIPLGTIRDGVPGYAVSLVKAGVAMTGLDVGHVRPPLVNASPEHVAELGRLLTQYAAKVPVSLS